MAKASTHQGTSVKQRKPLKPTPRDLSREGRKEWEHWVETALAIESYCVEQKDVQLLRAVHTFLCFLVQLDELYLSFRHSNGKVDGKGSVSSTLGITRNAVYLRLNWVGWQPDEFRERIQSECTLDSLLANNPEFKSVRKALQDTLSDRGKRLSEFKRIRSRARPRVAK